MFSTGEIFSGLATAAVVVVGVLLGVDGDLPKAALVAFLFLVTLFVGAGAGRHRGAQRGADRHRRLAPHPQRARHPSPTSSTRDRPAVEIPPGPIGLRFEDGRFPTRRRPPGRCCSRSTWRSRRRRGRDRRGDRLGQDHVRQAADPADGPDRGRSSSTACRCRVRFASLRPRVVMVPQDGFLFDASIAANVRHGRPEPDRRRGRGSPSPSSAWPIGSRRCRDGSTPASASAARRCPSANGSSWRWRAPMSPARTCWCSTRRPPPSTPPPRSASSARWTLTRGRTSSHRAPAVHRGDRRRGAGVRRRPAGAARPARRARRAPGPYARLHASWAAAAPARLSGADRGGVRSGEPAFASGTGQPPAQSRPSRSGERRCALDAAHWICHRPARLAQH